MPSRQAGPPTPTPAPRSSDMHLHWKHLLQRGTEMDLSLSGVGSTALGGWGAVSGNTSWALPLPLETAGLGESFSSCLLPIWLSTPKGFCLVYPSAPSRGSPYASGCPASEDPLESAKAPGEKLLGPSARGQETGGLRQVRAQVSPVSSRPVTPPADLKLHD